MQKEKYQFSTEFLERFLKFYETNSSKLSNKMSLVRCHAMVNFLASNESSDKSVAIHEEITLTI